MLVVTPYYFDLKLSISDDTRLEKRDQWVMIVKKQTNYDVTRSIPESVNFENDVKQGKDNLHKRSNEMDLFTDGECGVNQMHSGPQTGWVETLFDI